MCVRMSGGCDFGRRCAGAGATARGMDIELCKSRVTVWNACYFLS
jgi:hypothetical protein